MNEVELENIILKHTVKEYEKIIREVEHQTYKDFNRRLGAMEQEIQELRGLLSNNPPQTCPYATPGKEVWVTR